MSADKLQAVHEALADAFNESNLNATGTENSHPSLDHETLSKAFSEPHLNAVNTVQSFPRFDHAALMEVFSEPLPISPTERPSPASFDQAFAEILNERPPNSTNTKPPQPSFDHQALAEMLTELRADPVNPQMSPLSFDTESSSAPFSGQIDHEEPVAKAFAVAQSTNAESARQPRAQSLLAKLHRIFSTKEEPLLSNVEKDPLPPSLSGQLHTPEPMANAISILAEGALPQPANSLLAELSPLSLEQEPKSPHLSGQPGNGRPAVSDVAITSPTDSASAWPLQATSLPNEISSPISTNTETSSPTFERKSSTPTVAGRLGNIDPDVKAVAVAAPAEAEDAQPQQARSLLVEPVSPSLNDIEPPPPMLGKGYSGPILPGRLDLENVEPAKKPDVEWAQPPLTERPPLISPSTTPPLVLKAEPSQPVLCGQPDYPAPAEEFVPAAAPAGTENARSQLARSLLAELPPLISTDTESPPPNFQTEPSSPTLSGRLKNMTSAASTVAPTPPTNVESARPQRLWRLLAELTPTISTNPKPSLATSEKEPSRPTSSTQLKNLEPVARTASVVPLTSSESAVMQPREAKRLLSEVLPLDSTNTKSQPFIFEKDSSPKFDSGQPDHAESAAKILAAPLPDAEDAPSQRPSVTSFFLAAHPNEAEGALPQHANSLLAALRVLNAKPSPPLLDKEPSRSTLASQPDNAGISVETIAPPADTESAVTRAQQAKLLLAGLDLNTAIHLRWVMRDIRSKRTKVSPVSANDLSVLMELGLVEMREELPRLTGLGVLALD